MSSQWTPLPSKKAEQKPPPAGSLPSGATPANFIDRFREMNQQEQLIEQKKREIERKAMEKKKQEQIAAESGDAAAAKRILARFVHAKSTTFDVEKMCTRFMKMLVSCSRLIAKSS